MAIMRSADMMVSSVRRLLRCSATSTPSPAKNSLRMTAGRRFPQVSPMPAEPIVMSPPNSCSCSNLRQSPSAITERKTLAVQTKTSFNHCFHFSRILLASGYGDSPFTLLLTFYRQARSRRIGFISRGRACVTAIYGHLRFRVRLPSPTCRVAALRYA